MHVGNLHLQNKVVDDSLHEHGDQTLLTGKRLDKD